MAKSILNVREETTTLASYFAQFDKVKVTSEVSDDDFNAEVVVVNSTATSHGARVYVHYVTRYVEIEFVNRYTNEPTRMTRQHVRSTEELEKYLRQCKVLVDAKLISFEAASDDQLLTLAKGEGFDEWGGDVERAFNRGDDNGFLQYNDRATIVAQLRKMGFKSVDVTDPNWITGSQAEAKPLVATEAQWLAGMGRGTRAR